MSADRENLVYRSKLAEEAERFDDMVDFMKQVVNLTEGRISVSERNLLSTAYKNAVGTRRASWRVVSSFKTTMEDSDSKKDIVGSYCKIIEMELRKICEEILTLLDQYLIPKSTDSDSKVFYLKMKGDYFRYLAEFEHGEERAAVAEKSRKVYEEAFEIAKTGLGVAHPLRLGLVLNYSVFHYEILKQTKVACDMAQKTFDDALKELQGNDEEMQKDSTLILQLMRDNLSLWKAESNNTSHDSQTEELAQDSEVVDPAKKATTAAQEGPKNDSSDQNNTSKASSKE